MNIVTHLAYEEQTIFCRVQDLASWVRFHYNLLPHPDRSSFLHHNSIKLIIFSWKLATGKTMHRFAGSKLCPWLTNNCILTIWVRNLRFFLCYYVLRWSLRNFTVLRWNLFVLHTRSAAQFFIIFHNFFIIFHNFMCPWLSNICILTIWASHLRFLFSLCW